MFKNIISQTALTSNFANSYFQGKIESVSAFQRDCTFLTTLRALVAPRMSDNEKLSFYFNNSSPYRGELQEIASRIIDDVFFQDTGWIYVINIQSNNQDLVDKNMKAVETYFDSIHPGYCRVTKVTDFFRKVFKVYCYVNVESKSVVIIADNLDIKKYHFLQIGIFAFLPWYFDPSVGVSALEMELINSLREKTSDKYEECVDKIAEQYDFRTAGIKTMLKGFELKYEKLQRERTLREIERLIENINDLNDRIGGYLTEKRDAENLLFGLDMKLASDDEESAIMEYFLKNKRLSLISVDDASIEFVVRDYLIFFDEEKAKAVIDNPASDIYTPCGRYGGAAIKAEDMKMLMTSVFIDQEIKMRVCAAYKFRIGREVRALRGYPYGPEFRDYMPNVHIDRYECMGGYEENINKFLIANDYVGAIEQCVASCRSLNFLDGSVMREFMKRLYGVSEYTTNTKCFELPDGRVVTPELAIQYLKDTRG